MKVNLAFGLSVTDAMNVLPVLVSTTLFQPFTTPTMKLTLSLAA